MLLTNTTEKYIAFELNNDTNVQEVIISLIDSGYWVRTKKENGKIIIYIKEVSKYGN